MLPYILSFEFFSISLYLLFQLHEVPIRQAVIDMEIMENYHLLESILEKSEHVELMKWLR